MELSINILTQTLNDREAWLKDCAIDESELKHLEIKRNIEVLKADIYLLSAYHRRNKIKDSAMKRRFDTIEKYVLKQAGITEIELKTRARKQYITDARFIMFRMYYDVFRRNFYESDNSCFDEIGNYWNRDRNNIRNGVKVANDVAILDARTKLYLSKISTKLKLIK